MRTLFEDTELRADLEDENRGKASKHLLLSLWFVALVFLAGTWGVYRWAMSRPAPLPPPPPVSLDDLRQTGAAFSAFNTLIREGKWTEAEAMLSTAARQRLMDEKKTLSESLLDKFKNLKLVETASTPSIDRSIPGQFRQDFVYVLTDEQATRTEQKIIPLVLVIENGKIVLNSWWDDKQPPEGEKKPEEQKKA